MDYQILLDADFDEYAWEVESKGCIDVRVKLATSVVLLSFYDPARLAQEVEDAITVNNIFFERNIVVISKITRFKIETAVMYLSSSGALLASIGNNNDG